MRRASRLVGLAAALVSVAACGARSTVLDFVGSTDGAPDASRDGARRDGALDAARDSGFGVRDAGQDATRDSGHDATYDVGRDAVADVGLDVAPDTGFDAGRDGAPDAALDSGQDAPPDSAGAGFDGGGPPSCAPGGPGMTDCGAASESCCVSPEVTGGTFYQLYTRTADGTAITNEQYPASVSSLRVDKYEVTVGRFRQFVAAWNAGYVPPPGSGKHTHLNGGHGLLSGATPGVYETGWVASDDDAIDPTDANLADAACGTPPGEAKAMWTSVPGPHETQPINCVTWQESYAFCIWDGGFLPSFAELDYAEAGGIEELQYPWGTTPPGDGNQYAIWGCFYPDAYYGHCGGADPPATTPAPVGTAALGAGLWGQLDLAGNVAEWGLDLATATPPQPCVDCAALTAPGNQRVYRGSNFDAYISTYLLSGGEVDSMAETQREFSVGFRCARTP